MRTLWFPKAWEDYLYWQANDTKIFDRINTLIESIERDPFRGIGKPEPLKGPLSGWWSRRITDEHRLVYRVRGLSDAQVLEIAKCRLHY
jgi:toxin YoeB